MTSKFEEVVERDRERATSVDWSPVSSLNADERKSFSASNHAYAAAAFTGATT